jgi:predicted DNA-binding transcriptional regulator AlpA
MSLVQTEAPTLSQGVELQVYEADDLAKMLGVVERTIWRWSSCGILPKGVRLGSKRVWPRQVIDEFMAQLAEKAK